MQDKRVGADRSVPRGIGVPLLGIIAFIAAWWLATIVFGIRPFLIPAPPDVVRAFLTLPTYLLQESWITLGETPAGFLIATAVGLLLALILTASQLVQRAVM